MSKIPRSWFFVAALIVATCALYSGLAHAGSLPANCDASYTSLSAYTGPLASAPINVICTGSVTPPTPVPTPTPTPTPAPTPGTCATTDTATVNGATYTRVCTAFVSYAYPIAALGYQGQVSSLDALLGSVVTINKRTGLPNPCSTCGLLYGTFAGGYGISGKAFLIPLQPTQFVALAFTVPSSGRHGFQLSANSTFGDGGTIWLSTTPGGAAVTNGADGTCSQADNGSNSVLIYDFPGYKCSVSPGTYYVNIAGSPNSGFGRVSYTQN